MAERVIGIDLGTTNSCVAVLEGATATVIANRGGYKTTPSVVAMSENGKRLVGHIAKRQAVTNAENTAWAVKRLIGRPWTSPAVQAVKAAVPYPLAEGPHGDVRIRLRDQVFSVPEISAYVLQEMRAIAEEYLGQNVSKAVVTVPPGFAADSTRVFDGAYELQERTDGIAPIQAACRRPQSLFRHPPQSPPWG
jgi:molecular chaperone DnaK